MVSTMKIVDAKKNELKTGSSLAVRVNRTGRRTYTAEYKRVVVEQCAKAGVSVAGVALAHGINANLVRRWIVRQRRALIGRTDLPSVFLAPTSALTPPA